MIRSLKNNVQILTIIITESLQKWKCPINRVLKQRFFLISYHSCKKATMINNQDVESTFREFVQNSGGGHPKYGMFHVCE